MEAAVAGIEASEAMRREAQSQRLIIAYIFTGLLFMLLPGTFLGVWNLISISSRHSLGTLSPEWIQAHGHAQIFGWVGSFILGIGFYSISKMAGLPSFRVSRGWVCWALWTSGALARLGYECLLVALAGTSSDVGRNGVGRFPDIFQDGFAPSLVRTFARKTGVDTSGDRRLVRTAAYTGA
jgi:hypothetical protein